MIDAGGDRKFDPAWWCGTVIDFAGGARLTVNEQVREVGGITVTGVRLTVPGSNTEILLGYSTAAAHHCAP
ncbi:choice-of-anchor P family protein [Glycomyces tenuis]|uniref:choice-of-anchor P family protein n=1 Tax=Glycomyces tenuis TaxID=58116 RepID=UPI000479BBCD|nr:choice-of-anchor P family protein [Glycomyces tenuis]